MMFIEESLLLDDNNIKNILKNKTSNGISNTDRAATGILLEAAAATATATATATAKSVQPFVDSFNAAQKKEANLYSKLNVKSPEKSHNKFNLDEFHENLNRVKKIINTNNSNNHKLEATRSVIVVGSCSGGGVFNSVKDAAAGVPSKKPKQEDNTPAANCGEGGEKEKPLTNGDSHPIAAPTKTTNASDQKTLIKSKTLTSSTTTTTTTATATSQIDKLKEFKKRLEQKIAKDKENLGKPGLNLNNQSPKTTIRTDALISEEKTQDLGLVEIIDINEEEEEIEDSKKSKPVNSTEKSEAIEYLPGDLDSESEAPFIPDLQGVDEEHFRAILERFVSTVSTPRLSQSDIPRLFPKSTYKPDDFSSTDYYYQRRPRARSRRSPSPSETVVYHLEDLFDTEDNHRRDSQAFHFDQPPTPKLHHQRRHHSRLLNGNFANLYKRSSSFVRESRSEDFFYPANSSYYYSAEEDENEDEEEEFEESRYIRRDWYLEEENRFAEAKRRRKAAIQRTDKVLKELCSQYQMGFDFLNKIRRFLFTKPEDRTDIPAAAAAVAGESRKRRHDEDSSTENNNPILIKYRKVENHFPRVITGLFEDDMNPQKSQTVAYQSNNTMFPSRNTPVELLRGGVVIDNGGNVAANNRGFKEKGRNSMFSMPKKTSKILKPGATFAQFEFSDDDEVDLRSERDTAFNAGSIVSYDNYNNRNAKPSQPHKHHHHQHQHQQQLKHQQLNIMKSDDMAGGGNSSTSNNKSSVGRAFGSIFSTPYHQMNGGAASHTNGGNAVQFVGERKFCYADAVKYGISGLQHSQQQQQQQQQPQKSVIMERSASVLSNRNNCNNAKPKTAAANLISSWASVAKPRSVLEHQKEIEEREKYNKLLQTVAPHLYATENRLQAGAAAAATASSSRRNSILTPPSVPKVRRSIIQSTFRNPASVINLDDDQEDEDISITSVTSIPPLSSTLKRRKPQKPVQDQVIDLDKEDSSDSSDIAEVIDLDDIEESSDLRSSTSRSKTKQAAAIKPKELPFVEPVNSLRDSFKSAPHLDESWLQEFKSRWENSRERRKKELQETAKQNEEITAERKAAEIKLQEKFRDFRIVDPDLVVLDDFAEPEEEPEIIPFTPDQDAKIKAAIYGSPDQILVSKFNMNITRRDIHTLLNQNWLNDEVINFYMNLIMERGDLKHESHNYPRVYAMNTFFIPRLLQGGHAAVRRWTRKVDIFSKDVIPVPVHVGGVHWCMAIIHLKNRSIKYYDSMGTPNPTVLKALEKYIQDESLDKRKQPYDTSGFVIESVRDVPRQMNGSDCGVFSCMFAEYITRNRDITFSQSEMIYFRNKMILEIVQGELLR